MQLGASASGTHLGGTLPRSVMANKGLEELCGGSTVPEVRPGEVIVGTVIRESETIAIKISFFYDDMETCC